MFFVFKKHCYETLVNDRQIPDMACLKFTLSKTLGYGIVTGVYYAVQFLCAPCTPFSLVQALLS